MITDCDREVAHDYQIAETAAAQTACQQVRAAATRALRDGPDPKDFILLAGAKALRPELRPEAELIYAQLQGGLDYEVLAALGRFLDVHADWTRLAA